VLVEDKAVLNEKLGKKQLTSAAGPPAEVARALAAYQLELSPDRTP